MGSKSKSSSSSTNITSQEDNRIAATDNAVAVGRGGSYSVDASSTYANSPITVTTNTMTSDVGVAEAFSEVLASGIRDAGETSRAAIGANRDVSRSGLDLAGRVADDGFQITSTVVDLLAQTAQEVIGTVDEAARANSGQSYEFAGRVLDGYENARLEESERKFNQVMTAIMALGVVGLIAWAYVKGR